MTKTVEHVRRFVILGTNRDRFKRYLSSTVQFCNSQAEIGKAYDDVPDGLIWIAYSQKFTDKLLKTVGRRRTTRPAHGCVLTVASPRPASLPTLHALFAHIVGDSPSYRWLPKDELAAVQVLDERIDGRVHRLRSGTRLWINAAFQSCL